MQRNVLEYLERTAPRLPDKPAFCAGDESLSYAQLHSAARGIGSYLCRFARREPVAVFMSRHPNMVAAFFGVLYSGCYYIPLDEEMSRARIAMILESAQPGFAICDEKTAGVMHQLGFGGQVLLYADIAGTQPDEEALAEVRAQALDTDPMYIVFTSGSTGTPKGVLACHRNVIDYVEALSYVLQLGEETVFGMQVPLYVDACLKEIYPVVKHGATTHIVPKSLFMFPLKLIEYMNTYKVNTVCWVVSALTLISGFGALQKAVPQYWRTVCFGSEVFPIKQFNIWRSALPDARFINLYGPTEATGMSCWYEVDREFAPEEAIPIGRPFANTGIMLIGEDGGLVTQADVPGEIYIRGAGVTPGYYGDSERTAEVFVQNPLQSRWPEIVYRTGDMARYNTRGELVYISRRDHQIKHMGYRIELLEIEAAAARAEGVQNAACVFDKARDKIVLYYVGEAEATALQTALRQLLPRYMLPAVVTQLDKLPQTKNGKLDRVLLAKRAAEMP